MSVFFYGWRDRDAILDLFEMSSGQRMHPRYFQVGGVAEDVPAGWVKQVKKFTAGFPARLDQYADLIDNNQLLLSRLRGTNIVDKETLLEFGVTGPLAARRGQPVGPAQGRALLELRPLRLQDPDRDRRRQLRPVPHPHGRDA